MPIKKQVSVPRTKSKILEQQFRVSTRELKVLTDYAHKGAVFVVLGSEFTDTKEFYKGLRQLMVQPTGNGACLYDSNILIKDASRRDYILVALNDTINEQKIQSIKLVGRYRSKTLYMNKSKEKIQVQEETAND